MFLCNDFVWPIGQLEQEKGGHFLSSFSFAHYCCSAVANRATELNQVEIISEGAFLFSITKKALKEDITSI